MPFSDTQKVDFLWKKVSAGASKTDTAANKLALNETVSSPIQTYSGDIWAQETSIPNLAPGASGGVVEYLAGANAVQTSFDATAQLVASGAYPTWLGGQGDWIEPVKFGSSYAVQVYLGNPDTTGTLLNPLNAGEEFFFDYVSGVVHFPNDAPAALSQRFVPGDISNNGGSLQINIPGHPFSSNDEVYLTSSGAFPTGINGTTPYYVIVIDANNIQLSANPGPGAPIAHSATATGTLTVGRGLFLQGYRYVGQKGTGSANSTSQGVNQTQHGFENGDVIRWDSTGQVIGTTANPLIDFEEDDATPPQAAPDILLNGQTVTFDTPTGADIQGAVSFADRERTILPGLSAGEDIILDATTIVFNRVRAVGDAPGLTKSFAAADVTQTGPQTFAPGDTGYARTISFAADTAVGYQSAQTFLPGAVTNSGGKININIAGHGFVQDDRVRFSNSGGALPDNLAALTDYYIVFVDANNFQVSTAPGEAVGGATAVDWSGLGTAPGTGTHSIHLPALQINLPLHGFNSGDRVRLTDVGGGTLPPNLALAPTDFFVILVDANNIRLSATAGPGAPVDFDGDGTGTVEINDPSLNINIVGHGYTNNERVRFTSTATLPNNLTAATDYYVRVTDADNFEVSAAAGPGASVDFEGTGTGTHTVGDAELQVVLTNHELNDGDRVQFTTATTLPTGLVAATDYYVNVLDANTFQIATDPPQTNLIDFVDGGTGPHEVVFDGVQAATTDLSQFGINGGDQFSVNAITVTVTGVTPTLNTIASDVINDVGGTVTANAYQSVVDGRFYLRITNSAGALTIADVNNAPGAILGVLGSFNGPTLNEVVNTINNDFAPPNITASVATVNPTSHFIRLQKSGTNGAFPAPEGAIRLREGTADGVISALGLPAIDIGNGATYRDVGNVNLTQAIQDINDAGITTVVGGSVTATSNGSNQLVLNSTNGEIVIANGAVGSARGDLGLTSGTFETQGYVLAQADSADNAEVLGVVSAITDVDNFTFTINGNTNLPGYATLRLTASTVGVLTGTDQITLNGHGLANGDRIRIRPVGAGVLPSPLSVDQDYYVVGAATNTFQVSLTSGGAAINITTVGSGSFQVTRFANLIPGEAYFLSDSMAGTVMSDPPVNQGSVSKPIMVAAGGTATNMAFVAQYRGTFVGGAGGGATGGSAHLENVEFTELYAGVVGTLGAPNLDYADDIVLNDGGAVLGGAETVAFTLGGVTSGNGLANTGTATTGVTVPTDDIDINGTVVTFTTGTGTLDDIVADINGAAIANVTATTWSPDGGATNYLRLESTGSTDIVLAENTQADTLTDLGLVAGTYRVDAQAAADEINANANLPTAGIIAGVIQGSGSQRFLYIYNSLNNTLEVTEGAADGALTDLGIGAGTYTHTGTPGTMVVNHNLGVTQVACQVFDDTGDKVVEDGFTWIDGNTATLDLTSFALDVAQGDYQALILAAGASGGSSGGSSGAVADEVTAANSFNVGDVVYFDGTNYQLAQADDAATLGAFVVSEATANRFTVVQAGRITGLSGLTPGEYYFVSTSTPGALTTTEPATGYSNPILLADGTASGWVLPFRASIAQGGAAVTNAFALYSKSGTQAVGANNVVITFDTTDYNDGSGNITFNGTDEWTLSNGVFEVSAQVGFTGSALDVIFDIYDVNAATFFATGSNMKANSTYPGEMNKIVDASSSSITLDLRSRAFVSGGTFNTSPFITWIKFRQIA